MGTLILPSIQFYEIRPVKANSLISVENLKLFSNCMRILSELMFHEFTVTLYSISHALLDTHIMFAQFTFKLSP